MKTIFLTLFYGDVVRNFTFPDGVMDELIKHSELRIVALTAETFRERLTPYARQGTVVLEPIEKFPVEGFLQRLFQFFYSYLMFTGTTRVLATFGARADAPPAGGNRHAVLVKRLLAATLGRLDWVKLRLVPWLFTRMFRRRPYREIFDRYRPALVALPNIAFFPDIEILAEAKRRGIPTVGMPSNWDHLNKYFIPLHADRLLVQNEPMRDEAIRYHRYPAEAVTPVGFPQFDFYVKETLWRVSKEAFLEKFQIPAGRKIILYISGSVYALDEPDVLRAIAGWIEAGRFHVPVHLVVRPYVGARDLQVEREKYQDFANHPHLSFNWLDTYKNPADMKYYLAMLRYADVVISVFSTTAIEAAIFDKPTLTLGFDGYRERPLHQSVRRFEIMSHFKHVLKTGSVRVPRSFDELFQALDEYLQFPERDRDKRSALVEKMCYRLDGGASRRIVEAIVNHAYARR